MIIVKMDAFENEGCRQYISLLQDNINRMAANSSACKTWLVTILSALLAIQAALEEMTWILMISAIFLVILFYLLDSYYLGLEKRFIMLEERLIKHIKDEEDFNDDLYDFNPHNMGRDGKYTWYGMKSYSTWPFYGIIFLCIITIFILTQFF